MNNNLNHAPCTDADFNATALWEKFRQGDRVAYQKIYQHYLNGLYNYGFKIFPNRDVVTDCLQDLFIDLWKHKESLGAVGNVKHYLFCSLRNKILKEITRNRYQVQNMEQAFGNTLIVLPLEQKIIDSQTASEKKEKLQKAFLALSQRQQEVINLLFYEKFSYEQVAGVMHINLRSVYTLAWKALSQLRKELSGLFILLSLFLGNL